MFAEELRQPDAFQFWGLGAPPLPSEFTILWLKNESVVRNREPSENNPWFVVRLSLIHI